MLAQDLAELHQRLTQRLLCHDDIGPQRLRQVLVRHEASPRARERDEQLEGFGLDRHRLVAVQEPKPGDVQDERTAGVALVSLYRGVSLHVDLCCTRMHAEEITAED